MTKSDSTRQLVVAAIARQIASMLATFLTVPIIARQFGADSLGAWTLIVSGGLLLTLSDLGLSTAVRRAVLAGNDRHAFRALKRALVTAMWSGRHFGSNSEVSHWRCR